MTRTITHNKWARAALALFVLLGVLLCTFPALHTKAAEVEYQNVPEPTEHSIIFSAKTRPNDYITVKKGGSAQYQEGGKGDGGWQYDGDPGEMKSYSIKVLNPNGSYKEGCVSYLKDGVRSRYFLSPKTESMTEQVTNTEFVFSHYEVAINEILQDPNAQVYVLNENETELLCGSFSELVNKGTLNLDTKDLKKVTFKSPKRTPTKAVIATGRVYDEYDLHLIDDSAYMSPGTYDIGLDIRDVKNGSESRTFNWYFDDLVTIKNDVTLTLDCKYETQKYTINYDKAYTNAIRFSVSIYHPRNGHLIDEVSLEGSNIPSGSFVNAYKKGYPEFSVSVMQDDVTYSFYRWCTEDKTNPTVIDIGSRISGPLDYFYAEDSSAVFAPGTSFICGLYDATDEFGNTFSDGYTSSNASYMKNTEGYIVFTEVNTGKRIYQTLDHEKKYGRLETKLPTEEGKYSIEVKYFTKSKMPKNPVTPENPGIIAGSPKTLNGLVKGPDGKWAMYKNGKVDTSATGIFQNENGWWRVENGYVNFKANGIYKNEYGWWKTTDGKVTFNETGVFQNENGWWRVEDSKVNFKANGIYKNEHGWWKTTNGKVTFKETGVFKNENGWWRVEDSKVNFKANGIYKNDYGWWKTTNGKVTFKETGMFKNENGVWRVVNSKVDFDANGVYKYGKDYYKVTNGKVTNKENGVFQDESGDILWVVKNSKVDTKANGVYKYGDGLYKATNGKVSFNENGLVNADNGIYYVRNSKVDEDVTELVSNENGTYYVENGKVDTKKTGKFVIEGETFTLKNGKVV